MLKEHRNEKIRKNKTGYLSGMGISRSQTKNLSTSISQIEHNVSRQRNIYQEALLSNKKRQES